MIRPIMQQTLPATAASRAVTKGFTPAHPSARPADPRWEVYTHIRQARRDLGLKDRDLAVLRGLLSLLPVGDWGGPMVVFAANRTLCERCDGIEERTLRRRLAHLEEVGLIVRRQSPNGKRYAIRAAGGEMLAAYGMDLAPLARLGDQLQEMAAEAEARLQAQRSLKALIRDRLYHITLKELDLCPMLAEEARLAPRRNLAPEVLADLLTALEEVLATAPATPIASELSVKDSKIDRHILNHHQEDKDKNIGTNADPAPVAHVILAEKEDITLSDALIQSPTVQALAVEQPKSWQEANRLAGHLAPAIGVQPRQWQAAQNVMGAAQAALAIFGLVEAMGRIKKPQAYLARLMGQATEGTLDAVRMFRSLTRPLMDRNV